MVGRGTLDSEAHEFSYWRGLRNEENIKVTAELQGTPLTEDNHRLLVVVQEVEDRLKGLAIGVGEADGSSGSDGEVV